VAWRLVLTAVAVVALVVPGRWLASQHAEDDALAAYAGLAEPAHGTVGDTWRVDAGVLAKDRGTLVLVEVRPRVVLDTTGADITSMLCTPAAKGRAVVAPGPEGTGCSSLGMVTGGRASLRPGGTQIVVSVTPRRSGRLEVDGYDVTYVDADDRRTTEHAGTGFRLRVA
jgi:hypothetical protein